MIPFIAKSPQCKEVTQRMLGISESSEANLSQGGENRESLHSPPFWWQFSSQLRRRSGGWNNENYNYRNCKWEGCFKRCSCQEKEKELSECRFPNSCGYHMKQPLTSFNNEKNSCSELSSKKDTCSFCRMKINILNSTDGRKIPDPRCIGQYHLPLLEKIFGCGTALSMKKIEEKHSKNEDGARGYIPGDIYGHRSWSGKVGSDPMCEEFSNGIFLNEIFPYDMSQNKEMEMEKKWQESC